MLVLSRRLNEQIVFPEFQTAVKVIGIKGSSVRLGIDAPEDVLVLREELQRPDAVHPAGVQRAVKSTESAIDEAERAKIRMQNHQMRNRLNVAGLGLALLSRQLEAGLLQDCQKTLRAIHGDFDALRERLEETAQEHATAPVKFARTPKALLVEDDRNERELLAGFLRHSGLEVDWVEDGCDALEYLRSHDRPDFVLLDMVLPTCDGPTTVREIRRDPANQRLKIFAVTGYAPDVFHVEGVNRWFRKPLDPEMLLQDLNMEFAEVG